MDPNKPSRAGDLILDRYLPDADEETRERAREALRAWALVLIRIGERIAEEQSPGVDSPELDRRRTIPPTPPESLSA